MNILRAITHSFKNGIVYRLRLTFLSIATLLCLSGVGAILFLSQLNTTQRQLTHASVPALLQSQKQISQLADMLVTTTELRTAVTTQRVQELIQTQNDTINVLWNSLSTNDNRGSYEPILSTLARFEAISRSIGYVRQSLLKQTESLAANRTELGDIRLNVNDVTGTMLVDNALALNRALKERVTKPRGSNSNNPSEHAQLSTLIVHNKRISDITSEMSSVIDLAEQLSVLSTPAVFQSQTNRLRFKLRSITQALSRMPRVESTKVLARQINRYRQIVFGDDGRLAKIQRFSASRNAFQAAQSTQGSLADVMSERVGKKVTDTKTLVQKLSSDFGQSMMRTIFLFAITAISVLTVLLLATYYIVEKQINHRISKLAEAVLDIAAGNVTRDRDVFGSDELGEIASALTVFKKNARELKRSNEELEKFAYAASHDLRSPLRAIENLAQWTIEDSAGQLPESCNENLVKLLERAKRLSRLQSDLLEYSRAGHADSDVMTSIDLTQMLNDLSEMLDPKGNFLLRFGGQISSFECMETPLRQILLNLITNAMKHHDKEKGNIDVSTNLIGDRVHISVSDDGPGVPIEYHERIFGLFQTLRSRDEVEGSGLGLSLILKLVQRYGGEIEVRSNPANARGSVFCFDLPASAVQESAVVTSTHRDETVVAVDPLEMSH